MAYCRQLRRCISVSASTKEAVSLLFAANRLLNSQNSLHLQSIPQCSSRPPSSPSSLSPSRHRTYLASLAAPDPASRETLANRAARAETTLPACAGMSRVLKSYPRQLSMLVLTYRLRSKAFTQSAIGCVVGACKGDDLYVARYHLSHRPLDLPEEVSEFTVTDQSGKQLQGSTDCF